MSFLVPFPPFDASKFRDLLDEEMGFQLRKPVMPSRPNVVTAVVTENPQAHEDTHVHEVYDQIASHFSSTRYKPWPLVAQFLDNLPTGWVGLDSGTGNGKYLQFPEGRLGNLWTIGLDRSRNLLEIARKVGDSGTIREVVWGDVLGYGWRLGTFDYSISIATIHHLSTHERRKQAIQRLLQCVSPDHGRVLIYVWAIEQDGLSKRTIPSEPRNTSAQTPASSVGQDVFVPWVLSKQLTEKKSSKNSDTSSNAPSAEETGEPRVYHRYYHMFAEGELVALTRSAAQELELTILPSSEKHLAKGRGVEIVKHGWERSNYYVELKRWEC